MISLRQVFLENVYYLDLEYEHYFIYINLKAFHGKIKYVGLLSVSTDLYPFICSKYNYIAQNKIN